MGILVCDRYCVVRQEGRLQQGLEELVRRAPRSLRKPAHVAHVLASFPSASSAVPLTVCGEPAPASLRQCKQQNACDLDPWSNRIQDHAQPPTLGA